MKKISHTLLTALSTFFISAQYYMIQANSGLTNPAIEKQSSPTTADRAQSGGLFTEYFVFFWNTLITVGALSTLLYFVWGALDWVTSAGDKSKLESARGKMINAFLGMLILGSSFIIVGFVGTLLNINLLQPVFLTPGF